MIRWILMSLVLSCFSHAGKESGGGDAQVLEFVALGRHIARQLLKNTVQIPGISAQAFNHAVETAVVTTVDQAILTREDGTVVEVDAVNYPGENRIELSRPRWTEYANNLEKRLALVFHEYLGLLRIQDRRYELSAEHFAVLQRMSARALEQIILEELDEYCGDTWCEGDFDYRFFAMKCEEKAAMCTLKVEMTYRDTDGPEEFKTYLKGPHFSAEILDRDRGSYTSFTATCALTGYPSLESLVTFRKYDFYITELKDEVTDTLGDCFSALEDKMRRHISVLYH